jgi:hypothetical protein
VVVVAVLASTRHCSNKIVPSSSCCSSWQLTLCYVVGKTWEGMTFGFGTRANEQVGYAVVALKWQLVAGAFAIVHTMWGLMTQRVHADTHSLRCVCTACAPEYYETEPPESDSDLETYE